MIDTDTKTKLVEISNGALMQSWEYKSSIAMNKCIDEKSCDCVNDCCKYLPELPTAEEIINRAKILCDFVENN
jgi:hypothetical protein